MVNNNTLDLENKRVGTLLLKFAIPSVIGMITNSIFNIVDIIFVSRAVGILAVAGIGIVFPIHMIIMAVAQLIGFGSASIISRKLGKKNHNDAASIAGNSFILVACLSIAIVVLIIIFLDSLLKLFGTTNNIFPFARDYLYITTFGFLFMPFIASANSLIRAEGNAKTSMYIILLITSINLILDPILIFIFNLGIKGAAYATIIAQFIGFLYVLNYYIRGISLISIKFHHFRVKISIIKEIFSTGLASFIRQISLSLLLVLINNSIKHYGNDTDIAIYSIINNIVTFMTIPLLGIIAGLQPIIGYNYGNNNINRVKESLKISIISTIIFGISFFSIIMVFPEKVVGLFSKNEDLLFSSSFPLRMRILFFPFTGLQVISIGFFQSIGRIKSSIILSLTRQVLFLFPLILLLPIFLGINGIWIAPPISDLLTIVVTVFFLGKEILKLNKNNLKDK